MNKFRTDPYRGEREAVRAALWEVAPPPRLTPKALIAPHAGYIYSGGVAAAAFATLRDSAHAIKRVVLIGPAHYVPVPGIAVPTVSSFETPLGRVPVDVEALSALADLDFVVTADGPHIPEHCLEVELPFLQSVLASFQIVPLVVGDATPNDVARVLGRLWGGPETLIVVSSDLSHYHSYEVASAAGCSDRCCDRARRLGQCGPEQNLCGRPTDRGRAPRLKGPAAFVVQLWRHRRCARPRRGIRRLDVRADGTMMSWSGLHANSLICSRLRALLLPRASRIWVEICIQNNDAAKSLTWRRYPTFRL